MIHTYGQKKNAAKRVIGNVMRVMEAGVYR